MSALLYIPDSATTVTPAPAVLAVHGYINSRETQSPYAIELSRRGYVVLAIDQRGHGYSDPPAFADGFGGPAGLEYLRNLDFVDVDQIVLTGHSMGGWAVLSAAAAHPDDYEAVIVSGSSTGLFGVPEGDKQFPRNFAVLYGQYDELSAFMWGSPTAKGIVNTEKLKKIFGTDATVEAGKLYGNVAEGTARKLYQPAQTHPANHITHSGIAGVLDWVQTTTTAPDPINPDDQVWQWKEFGTLVSLAGGILFLFAFGGFGLTLPLFAGIAGGSKSDVGIKGKGWWLAAAFFVCIPALTYFPLQQWASTWPANRWLSQNFTTGFMVWALCVGLISTVLFLLWHFLLGGKRAGGDLQTYGLSWPDGSTVKNLLLSLLLAIVVVAGLYGLLLLVDFIFLTDFRWWIYALKLMNRMHFGIFLGYVVPFSIFFLIVGVVLHGQLGGTTNDSLTKIMFRNSILMGLGIFLLLAWLYIPLFTNGMLALPDQGLLAIIAMQFVVLLPLTGLISTYFFCKTGHVYLGAFINGLFLTWLIVAGQATHYPFQ